MWSTRYHIQSGRMKSRCCYIVIVLFTFLSGCTGLRHVATDLKGCGTYGQTGIHTPKPGGSIFKDVLAASYTAADSLAANLRTKIQKTNGSMLAASFVNINNLKESCPLGRIVSEQISSRMAQNGFRILEMKLRQNSIYIKEGHGEFLLSREIKEISESRNSDLVIVGTYAVAEKSIYISARIVNTGDSAIVTGFDYQLERNYQTDSLLGDAEG